MTAPAIEIHSLGKRYRLGAARASYLSLRDELARAGRRVVDRFNRSRSTPDDEREFWALRDLTVTVEAGEAVAVIGRNGAGKSTLLKILSRITPPTEGHVLIHGRASSLLEVGTGFHPELTGRENIYLNGAILGMTRREIASRFDEIVAFAEVDRFLDTPVKRYSSGMYVRLAFAVAAHLETEILIVDEVLAVGDVQFQQKCLSKMEQAASGGRTVLFVSHNLTAVQGLCAKAILLDHGRLVSAGDVVTVTQQYLRNIYLPDSLGDLRLRRDRKGSGDVRLTAVRLLNSAGHPAATVASGDACALEFDYEAAGPLKRLAFAWNLRDERAQYLLRVSTQDTGCTQAEFPPQGTLHCRIPRLPLVPGRYRLVSEFQIGGAVVDAIDGAFVLTVDGGDFYGTGQMNHHSPVLLDHAWEVRPHEGGR